MTYNSVVYNFRDSCSSCDSSVFIKTKATGALNSNENIPNRSRVQSLIYQFEQQTDNSINISNYSKFRNDSARSSYTSNVCSPKMCDLKSVFLNPDSVKKLMQKNTFETKSGAVIKIHDNCDNISKIPRIKPVDKVDWVQTNSIKTYTEHVNIATRRNCTPDSKSSIFTRKTKSYDDTFSSSDYRSYYGGSKNDDINQQKISLKTKWINDDLKYITGNKMNHKTKLVNIDNQRTSSELSKIKVRLLENKAQSVLKPKGAIPKLQDPDRLKQKSDLTIAPKVKKVPPPVPIRSSSIEDRKKNKNTFLSGKAKSFNNEGNLRRNDWQKSTIPTLENSSLNKRRVSYLKATRTDNDFEAELPTLMRRNSYVRDAIKQFEKAMTDALNLNEMEINEETLKLTHKQTDVASEKETKLDKKIQHIDSETTNICASAAQTRTDEVIETQDTLTIVYHEPQEPPNTNLNQDFELEDFKIDDLNMLSNDENVLVEIHRINLNETDTNISDIIAGEATPETDIIIIINDNEAIYSTGKTEENGVPTVLKQNKTSSDNIFENNESSSTTIYSSSTMIGSDSTCYEKHLDKALDKILAVTTPEAVEYMIIEECLPMKNNESYECDDHIYAELDIKVKQDNLEIEVQDDNNNNEKSELFINKLERNSIILENIKCLPDKDVDSEVLTELDFISSHEGSISDDEYTEAMNPLMSKNLVISEWIQNNIEEPVVLENCETQDECRNSLLSSTDSRNSRSSGISEDIDSDKYINPKVEQSLTYFDADNNPMVKMVSKVKSKFITPTRKDSVEINIDIYEKKYLENIYSIVNNSRLNDISAELISTEKTYIESLSRIVNDYIPELSKPEAPPSLIGKIRSIFGNADMLYEFHSEKFLPCLEKCKNAEEIAECFIENKDTFKLYALYSKNKPKSDNIMREYAGYFLKKKAELNDHFDVSSYLLTPIQRLGRYILLIERLAKEAEKENINTEKIKQAKDILKMQMRYGNDLIAIDQVVGSDVDLKVQGSILLRDSFLIQPPNKKPPFSGMVFLFEKSLLITKVELQNHSFQNNTEVFVFREFFKITDLGQTDNIEKQNQFKVWYRKRDQKSYTLTAKNPYIKTIWVNKIMDLLWIQLQNNKKQMEEEFEKAGVKMNMVSVTSPKPERANQSKKESRDNSGTRSRILSTAESTTSSTSPRKRRERSLRFISNTKSTSMWYTKDNSKSDC